MELLQLLPVEIIGRDGRTRLVGRPAAFRSRIVCRFPNLTYQHYDHMTGADAVPDDSSLVGVIT